ncbi:hypothetical protein [Herbidospora cretacea]|uniref:hypothetical protein n=1 Tax=Herbidospora cretacea TaxID=28444 RepID=UPI00077491BE|nr:hypothetical protein [Herbidospora cretacea]
MIRALVVALYGVAVLVTAVVAVVTGDLDPLSLLTVTPLRSYLHGGTDWLIVPLALVSMRTAAEADRRPVGASEAAIVSV